MTANINLNNNSEFNGASALQKEMLTHRKLGASAALEEATLSIGYKQYLRLKSISAEIKSVTDSKSNNIADNQITKLFELYSKIQKEVQFYKEYTHEMKVNSHSTTLSAKLVKNIKVLGNRFLPMQDESINGVRIALSRISYTSAKMKDTIKGMNNTLKQDPNIVHSDDFQDDFEQYKVQKNIIDNSVVALDKLITQCRIDGDKLQLDTLDKYRDNLVNSQNNFDNNFLAKVLTAEFTSSKGFIKQAQNQISNMEKMTALLNSNLAEYNNNPQKYGAKTNTWLSTEEFVVAEPNVRNGIASSSKYLYSKFIEKYNQKDIELRKIKGVDDKVLNDSAELIGNLSSVMDKLKNEIVLYKNKMNELLKNKSSDVISDVDANQVAGNLANVISEKKSDESDLREVANNMIREQNNRINFIETDLNSVKNSQSATTPDNKTSKLFEIYSKNKQEIKFLQEYSDSPKLGATLLHEIKVVEQRTISVQSEIMKSLSIPLLWISSRYSDMRINLPGIINSLKQDQDLIHEDEWQEELVKYETHKNSIDNSLIVLNSWIDKCNLDGDTEALKTLNKYKDHFISNQTKFDKIGLTDFVIKGLTAEFTSSKGFIKQAQNQISNMEKMTALLNSNLAEYNNNPQKYGAKTNTWLSTGEFVVAEPNVRNGIASSSKYLYSKFIEKYNQKDIELRKIKGVDDKVLNDSAELIGNLSFVMDKLNNEIVLYKNKMNELLKNKSSDVISDVDANQVAGNLVNAISEKKSNESESSATNNAQKNSMHLPMVSVEMNS